MLHYKKMNLFNAPQGSVLVHACNAKGVMGSGIAKEMKERFPKNFQNYNIICSSCNQEDFINDNEYPLGSAIVYVDDDYTIGNLITSMNFGPPDSPDDILFNTVLAIDNMISNLAFFSRKEIYSNKFNSGLFNVPWEQTEAIIKKFVDKYNLEWTVCII